MLKARLSSISLRKPRFLTALTMCQYENKRCQGIMVREEERGVFKRSSNGAQSVAVSFLSTSHALSQLLPSSQPCNSVPLKVQAGEVNRFPVVSTNALLLLHTFSQETFGTA